MLFLVLDDLSSSLFFYLSRLAGNFLCCHQAEWPDGECVGRRGRKTTKNSAIQTVLGTSLVINPMKFFLAIVHFRTIIEFPFSQCGRSVFFSPDFSLRFPRRSCPPQEGQGGEGKESATYFARKSRNLSSSNQLSTREFSLAKNWKRKSKPEQEGT